MNISLTPELEKYIEEKVKSGLYITASEVVREGLRLLREQDQLRELRLEELRKEIDIGIRQAENGQFADLDMAAIKDKAEKQRARKRKAG